MHDFKTSLAFGEAAAHKPFWESIYRAAFPGFVSLCVNSENNGGQRVGIDHVLVLSSGATILIDTKIRGRQYGDVLLEWESSPGRRGWIRKDLQIDYLAYAWLPTRQCLVLPWLPLRRAWQTNCKRWGSLCRNREDGYREVFAENQHYVTKGLAIPRHELLRCVAAALWLDLGPLPRKAA